MLSAFFVALSVKSFTLSTPKATSSLFSLIAFSLLKHYTQQQKSLSSSWLPARSVRAACWCGAPGDGCPRAAGTPAQTPEQRRFLMCSDACLAWCRVSTRYVQLWYLAKAGVVLSSLPSLSRVGGAVLRGRARVAALLLPGALLAFPMVCPLRVSYGRGPVPLWVLVSQG